MGKTKTSKINIGIVGVGEIGSAVSKLYKGDDYNLLLKDFEMDDCLEDFDLDFLHICIPYTSSFIDTVAEYIKKYDPRNVIIHSTVKVGTTSALISKTKKVNIFHSPVRS